MKRKVFCLFLFCVLLVSTVGATPEIWSGISVSSGRNYFASGLQEAFTGNKQYNGKKRINNLGPGLDIAAFPDSRFRLGLVGSVNFLVTIGMDGSGYFSRHFDHSNDLSIGLAYYQLFSNDTWGFFLDGRYFSRQYAFADSNEKNNKQEVVNYYSPTESGYQASIGFLAKHKNSYFKMGFRYSMPTSYEKNDGWGLDVVTGGGICF